MALLHRVNDKKNKEFLIVLKEFANPTGLLDEIMRDMLLPLQKRMQDSIRELLGQQASDMQIQFCEISIISQCINPMVLRMGDDTNMPTEIKNLKAYANHVVRFSLAGIHKIQEQYRKKTFSKRNKVGKTSKRKTMSLLYKTTYIRYLLHLSWMPLVLIMTGCVTVGPDYVRPETSLSTTWHTNEKGD